MKVKTIKPNSFMAIELERDLPKEDIEYFSNIIKSSINIPVVILSQDIKATIIQTKEDYQISAAPNLPPFDFEKKVDKITHKTPKPTPKQG